MAKWASDMLMSFSTRRAAQHTARLVHAARPFRLVATRVVSAASPSVVVATLYIVQRFDLRIGLVEN